MTWDHGYFVGTPYTASHFRELSPNWIDFAALCKGHSSPRVDKGQSFTYLELGSGMGFGLCMMAALFPEGDFYGIDFMPVHIAYARDLARSLCLTNVQFLEADLLDIATDPRPLRAAGMVPTSCHYVVSHGLLTWVNTDVQSAILAVASAALRPEGLFLGSYNTYPGWLPMGIFQHLVTRELARSDPSIPPPCLNRAVQTLQILLGGDEQHSPLQQAYPQLLPNLNTIPRQDSAYIVQEYANQYWQPLYVAQLHDRCKPHKLRYIATATLPDVFEGLLPESTRSLVQAEANSTHRQTLIDLATNRAFRRDIFSRGSMPLRTGQLQRQLESIQFRLQEAPPLKAYTFKVDYGDVTGKPEVYEAIEQALFKGPLPLGELANTIDQPLQEIVQAAAFLLHANRVGIDRSNCETFAKAQENALHVNAYLLAEIQEGAPYAQLAAPAIGGAVGVTPLESLLIEALRQGLEGNVLAACVQMGLQGLNVELCEKDGKPLTTDAARRKAILRAAEAFASQRLPFLRSLGVVPS